VKKLLLVLLLLLIPVTGYSRDIIDGKDYQELEVADWSGMSAPSVSSVDMGRVYYDSISDTLKLSLDGGAYFDILTSSSVVSYISNTVFGVGWNGVTTIAPSKNVIYDEVITYLKLDGSNANQNIDIGTYNFTTTGDITGGSVNVAQGTKVNFEGILGDTYIKYNSLSGKLEFWVDGVKIQEL